MKRNHSNRFSLERLILISLVVANMLFLVYWSILAYYSRLQHDDLYFLGMMREMSLFDYVKNMYLTRSGRFVGYTINGIVAGFSNAVGFHQLWVLVYYFIGVGFCWLSVRDLNLRVSRFGLFMGIYFLYNLYVLTNIDFPVFFWLCALSYYLYFPMTCLFLKYLNTDALNWKQIALLFIMTVFLGGTNETFTPMVLLLMLGCGLYWWHSKGWNAKETWALPQARRIVWTAVALLIILSIVVAAPGNYVRLEEGMGEGEGFVHPSGIVGWLVALAKTMVMFLYFMAFYIPYYLVAFALAFYVGTKSERKLPVTKPRLLLLLAVGFLVYLAFSCLPDVYLYCNFRLQRNYTHVVFVWLLTVVLSGYICGHGRRSLSSGGWSIVGVLALAVITCINLAHDVPTAKKYGKAVDERVEQLCALKNQGQKETAIVKPLPIPYTEDVKHFVLSKLGKETPVTILYYYSEAECMPSLYSQDMKLVYDLDFDIVLPPECCDSSESYEQ